MASTVIDASFPPPAPLEGHLKLGGKNPSGREIGVNSRWLTLDGRPWFPVMGEFHFSRCPAEFWEDGLLKMKAAGITVVASYLFWIHHEEIEGEFDWTGRRDIGRFVDLCGKHGLYFFLRFGPWAHGECRNGGTPDWILKKCARPRSNDADYMGYVERYFAEMSARLKGKFWKDGGPIVGIQIENEYGQKGPGRGAEHILQLKRTARAAGMDAPLWTVTGWGDVEYPADEVMPVFGMYPDEFWRDEMDDLAPDFQSIFVPTRNDPTIGSDQSGVRGGAEPPAYRYPYATCEMGGGIQVAYHRRPFIFPDDAAAMNLTRVGSGVNMHGYYVFHGGTNPDGRLTTMQESHATGYPNDTPVKSYDFQAPIREYGRVSAVCHRLRLMHTFINDFGSELAGMSCYLPDGMTADWRDVETLRAAARVNGRTGFVFVTNHQRFLELPEKKQARITLTLEGETLRIPSAPVDVPAGSYFVWPVNMDVNGALLKHATAQPLCRIVHEGVPHHFFFAVPGIAPEFVFAESTVALIETAGESAGDDGTVRISGLNPGGGATIAVDSADGRRSVIVLLSRDEALESYRLNVCGTDSLLITSADPLAEENRLRLRARDTNGIDFRIFPHPPVPLKAGNSPVKPFPGGIFTWYRVPVPRPSPTVTVERIAGARPGGRKVKLAKHGWASAPEDAEFDSAPAWRVSVAKDALEGLSDLFLRVDYRADVLRAYVGGKLVADDFYYGRIWEMGMRRFAPGIFEKEVVLKFLPFVKSAPIYVDKSVRSSLGPWEEVLDVRSITVVPEVEVSLGV